MIKKNDGKMFKYYKRLDDVLMLKYRLIHGHFQIGLVMFPRPHIGPKDDNPVNMEMPNIFLVHDCGRA
jgi:hypothetical protein